MYLDVWVRKRTVAVHREERASFINKRRSQKPRESLLGCSPVNHEGDSHAALRLSSGLRLIHFYELPPRWEVGAEAGDARGPWSRLNNTPLPVSVCVCVSVSFFHVCAMQLSYSASDLGLWLFFKEWRWSPLCCVSLQWRPTGPGTACCCSLRSAQWSCSYSPPAPQTWRSWATCFTACLVRSMPTAAMRPCSTTRSDWPRLSLNS